MTATAKALPGSRRWDALAILFLAQLITTGTTAFGLSLFVKPIANEFGLSRADAGLGAIAIIVGIAIWSPFAGRAIDGMSPRKVLVAGALLFSSGITLVALSSAAWLNVLAAVVLIGGGAATLGAVCGSTLAARWFPDCLGRALAIISASGSVGGAIFVPVLAWLVGQYGWRATLGITAGLVALVVAVPVAFILRGAINAAPQRDRSAGAAPKLPARHLLTSLPFWLIVFVFGSSFAITHSILTNLMLFTEELGLSAGRGVTLLSVISISGIAGKLLAGWLLDKNVSIKVIQIAAVFFLGLFMLAIYLRSSYETLIGCSVLAGMSIGATTLMWVAIVKWCFGSDSLGSTLGFMVPIQMPFVFTWLYLVGALYDRSQNYDAVFELSLVYLGIIACVIVCIDRSHLKVVS